MSVNLRKIGGRGIKSLFISIVLHVIALILGGLFMISQNPKIEEDFFTADIFRTSPEKIESKPKPPKRRLNVTKKIALEKKVSGSAHKISEVIKQAPRQVISDANLENYKQKDEIPDITTIAPKVRTSRRTIRIPGAVSTANRPTSGDGIQSFRQRAGGSGTGQGEGGFGDDVVNTTVATELGVDVLDDDSLPKEPEKELTPFGEALTLIAEHISGNTLSGTVDVVFVVDTSLSMQDNIDKVADNLYRMIETYEKYGITYKLGVVEFSVRQQGEKIDIKPLTTDHAILKKRIESLSLSGDEHALDALTKTLSHMNFTPTADKNLVLITDEPASTSWKVPNAYKILRNRIISDCQSAQIAVNVLGANRSYQKRLAKETGGLWVEIPGGQRKATSSPAEGNPQKAELMRGFRKIATNIARKAPSTSNGADIIFAVDISGSMGSKSLLVLNGIQSMIKVLELLSADYLVGLMRFATKSTVQSIDGVDVMKMPVSTELIMSSLQVPYGGDEYLLDAIVEGLPKINFRANSERFLIIITDEPSTGKYTTEQALEVCKEKSVQVFVIGALPEGIDEEDFDPNAKISSDDFQFRVVNQTGGMFYPMSNSLKSALPEQ